MTAKRDERRERECEREILRERMKDLAYPPLPFSDHAEEYTTLSFYYKNSALSLLLEILVVAWC